MLLERDLQMTENISQIKVMAHFLITHRYSVRDAFLRQSCSPKEYHQPEDGRKGGTTPPCHFVRAIMLWPALRWVDYVFTSDQQRLLIQRSVPETAQINLPPRLRRNQRHHA
jgi:hypothetical protein